MSDIKRLIPDVTNLSDILKICCETLKQIRSSVCFKPLTSSSRTMWSVRFKAAPESEPKETLQVWCHNCRDQSAFRGSSRCVWRSQVTMESNEAVSGYLSTFTQVFETNSILLLNLDILMLYYYTTPLLLTALVTLVTLLI